MKETRPYVMRVRADSMDATRQRILDAAVDGLWRRRASDVRLEDVATAAGATVQTVLRIFGSKSALLASASAQLRDRIVEQRESAAPGDIAGTVSALFDHYEDMGDFVIRNLADEGALPELRGGLEQGRRAHRRSMRRQFAPQLGGREDGPLLLDALVIACDVEAAPTRRGEEQGGRRGVCSFHGEPDPGGWMT